MLLKYKTFSVLFLVWNMCGSVIPSTASSRKILPDFPPVNCRTSPVDILLLHDFGDGDFQERVEDFSSFVSQFGGNPLNLSRVHIAWASYGQQVTVHSNFSMMMSPSDMINQQEQYPSTFDVQTEISDVGAALRFVIDTAFGQDFGSRDSVIRVVLMIAHSLPNINVEDADYQISRLEKSDIKLLLLHFNQQNEKIDITNPKGLPYRNAIFLRKTRDYSDVMRSGIARLLCFPNQASVPGTDRRLKYHIYDEQEIPFGCPVPSDGVILETADEMINLEKHIFQRLQGRLVQQHRLKVKLFNQEDVPPILFKLNLHRRYDGDTMWYWPTGRPKVPNPTPEGMETRSSDMMWSRLVYDNWDPRFNNTAGDCALWHFPSVYVSASQGSLNSEQLYEYWKSFGGATYQAHFCNDLDMDTNDTAITSEYVFCEWPTKPFIYQPMALTNGSQSETTLALKSRGHFALLKDKVMNDFRLESVSNMLAGKNNIKSGWTITSLLSTASFDDILSIPRYTCHIGPRRLYLPYSWLLHPKLGCQYWQGDQRLGFSIPQYKQTHISCSQSLPCVLCMNHDNILTYNSGNNHTSCEDTTCPDGHVKCPNSAFCIPIKFLRDVYQDCPGGEDEIVDLYQVSSGLPRQWSYDCPSFTHMSGVQDKSAQDGKYLIVQITQPALRNGVIDCPFGEDELIVPTLVKSNYQCLTDTERPESIKLTYISPARLCDGVEDCPYGDDEVDCDVRCAAGLVCVAGTVRVQDLSRIPADFSDDMIDDGTRYLDLSGLKMVDLKNLTRTNNLRNVIHLKLSECGIQNLRFYHEGNQFRKVEVLDLSRNVLDPRTKDFVGYDFWIRNTLTLNFSYNPDFFFLKFFDRSKRLKGEFAVRILDLSYTRISNKDRLVFSNFRSLEELYLKGCPISDIKQVFPVSLLAVDLQDVHMDFFYPDMFSELHWLRDIHVTSSKICCQKVIGELGSDQVCVSQQDDVISSCDNLIKEATLRLMVWLVGLVAFFGNTVSIVYRTVWNRKSLKLAYGLFVLNLSIADMLMGVNLIIIAVADVLYRGEYVLHDDGWRHGNLCKVCGCLSALSSEASVMFILCVTIDRFLVIKYPLGNTRISHGKANIMCGIVWVLCLIIAFLPLLPDFSHWQLYSASSVCIGLPLTNDKFPGWEYSMVIFVGLNLALFVLIAGGQVIIYNAVAASSRAVSSTMSQSQSERRVKNDMAIAKQLFLIVFTDFLCWFPIGVMGIRTLTDMDVSKEAYAWSAVILVPINSAVNPILYTLPIVKEKLKFVRKKFFNVRIDKISNQSQDVTDTTTSSI